MSRRRVSAFVAALAAVLLILSRLGTGHGVVADDLPSRLSDSEFWRLATTSSEEDGTFHSENLVSNEARFQTVIPSLARTAQAGRVYLGVGPEQNFSYIVAVRPKLAIIVDVRRGNFDLQLIYKALFEMSEDRAEFVSRLFSRPRPDGLTSRSSAAQIFDAYQAAPPSTQLFEQNLAAVEKRLETTHGFALTPTDHEGIAFVYRAWFESGPGLHYELTTGRGGFWRGNGFPTYADLMTATDGEGHNRSYLATEDSFRFLKDLEARNLVVPVVGNFGGSKALRAVGAYLTRQHATVSAFYVSNVEQYLRRDGIWGDFCTNVARLPLDPASVFIRATRGGGGPGPGLTVELHPMMADVASCSLRW